MGLAGLRAQRDDLAVDASPASRRSSTASAERRGAQRQPVGEEHVEHLPRRLPALDELLGGGRVEQARKQYVLVTRRTQQNHCHSNTAMAVNRLSKTRSAPPAATSRCKFCQNWDISKSREMDTRSPTRRRPSRSPRRGRARAARSVAFTYNDPVIFAEYAIDVADACRERGHQDGRGHRRLHQPEPAREFFAAHGRRQRRPQGFTEDSTSKITCSAISQPVLDTLRYLMHETEVWIEITTLLIPGKNDSDAEIDASVRLGRRASSAPTCRCTSPRSTPTTRCSTCRRTPAATLTRARAHRAGERPALRLHRQRARSERRDHLLPRLRRPRHRARLVRHRPGRLRVGRAARALLAPAARWSRACTTCRCAPSDGRRRWLGLVY